MQDFPILKCKITKQRRVLRRRALTRCFRLISLHVRRYFIKIFIKKLCSFLYFYKNTLYVALLINKYGPSKSLDYFIYIFTFTCIQCSFTYILNIRVLVVCTLCSSAYDELPRVHFSLASVATSSRVWN